VNPVLTAVLAVVGVAVLALFMRGGSRDGDSPRATEPREGDAPEREDAGLDESGEAGDDDLESVDVVAVTSDGCALVPDTHAVRLVPPHEDGEAWKAGEAARERRGQLAIAMSWHAAEFTGARVVRGDADEAPWRLEALGLEGEYTTLLFETRDGADAALRLFESRGVIRLGEDEDGRAMPPSPEQFTEARRIALETEAALDADDEPGR
jgi:hypothetical protein